MHFGSWRPSRDWSAIAKHEPTGQRRGELRTYDQVLNRNDAHLIRIDVFSHELGYITHCSTPFDGPNLRWWVLRRRINFQLEVFRFRYYLKEVLFPETQ